MMYTMALNNRLPKLLLLIMSIAIILFLSSCGSNSESDNIELVSQSLEILKDGNSEEICNTWGCTPTILADGIFGGLEVRALELCII